MAALTPVASVDALLGAIQKSGLLTADKLAKVRDAAAQATDPKQLARELVKDGTLTKWQAGQLLHGYYLLVIGKYKLLEELSAAPTGRIYLVEHAQIGRRHTLKVLAKRLASNPEAVKQFLNSAQNACGLDHRNVSHVYDVNQDGDRHYVVMEYVEGQDLERMVEHGGRLNLPQALDFIVQAAEGLAHAHENGVVHGDLKPSNLLRDHSGTIKILEIGQTGTGATFESEGADESIEMAALAAVIFQAPELRGDGDVADVACDVYSLGSVLCFLLTGKAAADAAAARKQLEAAGDISADVIESCSRWMADNPAQRPKSMAAVLEQLAVVARHLAAPPKKSDAAGGPAPEKKEKVSAKSAESPPKGKQPPVAKALDSNGTSRIVIPDETHPVIEPAPLGPIIIKTRGRGGKKPAAKGDQAPTVQAKKDASEERPEDAAPAKTYTPLVIAGAIGGGGVLVLGLLITLVCLLAFGRNNKPVVQTIKTKTGAPAVNAVAKSAAATEANPETATLDKNPEVAVSKSAESSAPAGGSSPVKESVPEPTVATAASAVADEKKASPSEAKSEPKVEPKPEPPPEPKPAAKPAAPKAAPKPEAKPDPFKGLAKAVSLPDLPEAPGQPATDALSPLTLGPCKVDDKVALIVTLLGGDTAIRGSRQKFDIQPKADSPRDWDFVLGGGAAPLTIAGLSAKEGNLLFQWTEVGVKQASVAKQLCNCALNLVAGTARQVVALRTTVIGLPLVVEIDKPSASAKWNIGDLPVAKQMFIEVTRTEGIKRHRQEPKGPVNVGEVLTVWTGVTEKSAPLALTLMTSSTARGVEVKLQPQVRLEGYPKVAAYRRKDLVALQQQAVQQLPLLEAELKKTKDSRPSGDAEKLLREQKISNLASQQVSRSVMLDQINYLLGFTETFQDSALIHFRVYYQAGDTKIDLLSTEEEAPVKPK